MEKRELETVMEGFMELAKTNLKRDGFLVPVVFIIAPNRKTTMVPLNCSTPDEKHYSFSKITELAISLKAIAIILVAESWMLKYDKPGLPLNIPIPSEHPDRIECIHISCDTTHYTLSSFTPFRRAEGTGEIVFGKTESNFNLDPHRSISPFSLAFKRAEGRA